MLRLLRATLSKLGSSILVAAVAAALVVACGDDDGPAGPTDSGPRTDLGVPTPPPTPPTPPPTPPVPPPPPLDGGPTPTDAGPPTVDAGPGPTDSGPAVDAGRDNTCTAASECVWGEIDHEITQRSDCICLFGCPSIAQNRETVDRRTAQYRMFCDPGTDGMGNPCPVDDCIAPPPLSCTAGVCTP